MASALEAASAANGEAASKSFDRMAKSSDSMVLNKSLAASASPPFSATRLLTSNLKVYTARLKALPASVQYFLLTYSETSPDKREDASFALAAVLFRGQLLQRKSGRRVGSRGLVEVQVTRLVDELQTTNVFGSLIREFDGVQRQSRGRLQGNDGRGDEGDALLGEFVGRLDADDNLLGLLGGRFDRNQVGGER